MPNKHRGEVVFTMGNKAYTLHLSTNAMCNLEGEFDLDIQAVFLLLDPESSGQGFKLSNFRKVVKAMLFDNHSDLSDADVGRLIDDYGLDKITEKVSDAAELAFPKGSGDQGKLKAVATK